MEVLKEQEAAIDEVHRRFIIGPRHNVSVDKDTILKDIARDYSRGSKGVRCKVYGTLSTQAVQPPSMT